MTPVRMLVAGDPDQMTGGYRYDARIASELRTRGCPVEVVGLAGRFPQADAQAARALDDALSGSPDGTLAVVDGLVLGGLPTVVAAYAARLRLVALIHHPLADEYGIAPALAERFRASERQALGCVHHVVVTSRWTARHLNADYGVPAGRLSTVEPGVDRPPPMARTPNAVPQLLCVATLVPRKGQLLLVRALARLAGLPWQASFIGDDERDRAYAAEVAAAVARCALGGRIALRGRVPQAALEAAYRSADLFVLPSYGEGYGMVIAEALCRGLPIVTTDAGALAETLPAGAGIAVAAGDDAALAAVLHRALTDASLRERLAAGARRAGAALPTWEAAGARFLAALQRAGAAHGAA